MKTILFIAMSLLHVLCTAKPTTEAIEACVKGESVGATAMYAEIVVNEYNDTEDNESSKTVTTFRHGKESIGVWQTAKPKRFGLTYNQKEVGLNLVRRLSSEEPAPFDPYRAIWGTITSGPKSYVCIAFNFDGIGQSGTFQAVRGVYLFERNTPSFRPYYTVGRVTDNGVILAR